ncbi:MAG: FkbM family methyltransferase [Verrucomicrobiota bacterium]
MFNKLKRQFNIWRNLQNPLTYWGYKYGIVKREPLFLKLPNGVQAEVPGRMIHTFKESVFQEDYIKGFPTGVFNDFGAPTVVDVGANVGYFSLWWLSRFPRSQVIAVEPMPNNFALLARNKALNPDKIFKVVNCAMRNQAGHIILNFDQSDSFTTSASVRKTDVSGGNEISVKAISLAQLIADFGLKRIDFLKLDCEGSEYDILYNCDETILRSIRCIAMETHQGAEAKECKEAMCDFLRSKKFQINTKSGGHMVYARQ